MKVYFVWDHREYRNMFGEFEDGEDFIDVYATLEAAEKAINELVMDNFVEVTGIKDMAFPTKDAILRRVFEVKDDNYPNMAEFWVEEKEVKE